MSFSAMFELDAEGLEILDAAVGDVDDVVDTAPAQERDGERAAVAGRASDSERLVAREAGRRPVAELVVGHVDRPLDVPLLPLVVLAHVEERHVSGAEPLGEAFRVDRGRRGGGEIGRLPRRDPARDEAAQAAEADGLELTGQRPRVVVARREDDDLGFRLEHPRGASADAGVRLRDADRARDVDGVELARVAAVDERRACLEELPCPRGGERLQRAGLGDERPAVQLDDPLEVRRLRGEVAGQLADELVLLLDPEQRVEAALEAERRARLPAHPRAAAERAADVSRPDLEEVLVLQQPPERAVQVAGALLGLDGQVGPRHVADEERVAGQDEPRALVAASVLDEEREVLGPVAGRPDGEVVGPPRAGLVPEPALVRGVLLLQLDGLFVDLARADRPFADVHSPSGHARSCPTEPSSSRRRHAFPAARPSGVARKCSSGTWTNPARASASDSSPSKSSPRTRMRRPRLDSTVALTRSSVLIGTGWR